MSSVFPPGRARRARPGTAGASVRPSSSHAQPRVRREPPGDAGPAAAPTLLRATRAGVERNSIRGWLVPAVAVILGGLALLSLHAQLHAFRYRQIAGAVRSLPARSLIVAGALTLVAYAILPAYDALALRYVGRPLGWRRTTFTSLVAYGFSQTIGLAIEIFLQGIYKNLVVVCHVSKESHGRSKLQIIRIAENLLYRASLHKIHKVRALS